MLHHMSYDQALNIFKCPQAAIQLLGFKNRMYNRQVFNQVQQPIILTHVEQPRIMSQGSSRPWPNPFFFPTQNVGEVLSSRLNNPFYELDRWDVIRLIRILFNQMILYRV